MGIRAINETSERAETILSDYAQDVEGIEPSQTLEDIAFEILEKEEEIDLLERAIDDLASQAEDECARLVSNKKRESEVGACPVCGYLNCVIEQHKKESL